MIFGRLGGGEQGVAHDLRILVIIPSKHSPTKEAVTLSKVFAFKMMVENTVGSADYDGNVESL